MFWENNRFMDWLTKFSHMIVLSALWVICSLPVLCSCKNNSLRDRLSDSRIFPLYERKLQTGCACKYREFVCISVLLWNLSVCYVTWTYKQLWKIVLHSLLAGGSGCHIYGLLSDFRNFRCCSLWSVQLWLFIFFHRLCSFCLRPMHFL